MSKAKEFLEETYLLSEIKNLKGYKGVLAMLKRAEIMAYIEAHETFDNDEEED